MTWKTELKKSDFSALGGIKRDVMFMELAIPKAKQLLDSGYEMGKTYEKDGFDASKFLATLEELNEIVKNWKGE
tara:strand:- start:185 stop:406 length:222 start_codon:yes stop_codon:yes gene_type:complete